MRTTDIPDATEGTVGPEFTVDGKVHGGTIGNGWGTDGPEFDPKNQNPDFNNVVWPGWDTLRLIGHGSFGSVYEIQRVLAGEQEKAALKVISIPKDERDITALRQRNYTDEDITEYFTDYKVQFEKEYAMMVKMKGHPNIAYCDDIRTVQRGDGFGWDIYIKMELLEPLKEKNKSGMPEEVAIKLGKDICNALIYCEKMGVVHRDIKPDNIFISKDGSYKLGDFGIARTMEGTSTGTVIGTPEFMAPEVTNTHRYSNKADIYSLGMTLYYLLNEQTGPFLDIGKRPTYSEKTTAYEKRVTGTPLPEPKHGSEKLKAVIMKACAYDPSERYQSAADMLDALSALDVKNIGNVSSGTSGFSTTGIEGAVCPELNSAGTYGGTIGPELDMKKSKKQAQKKPWWLIVLGLAAIVTVIVFAISGRSKDAPVMPTYSPTPTHTATPAPTPTPKPTPEPEATSSTEAILAPEIVDFSSGSLFTLFLKSDGTVTCVPTTGNVIDGRNKVSEWKNIVAVAAGENYAVGVKSDGTVISVDGILNDLPSNSEALNMHNWKNIVDVCAGYSHTVGLKADGTVVATGDNIMNVCEVSDWKDIVAVSTGMMETIGLKSDGNVITTGGIMVGVLPSFSDVSAWKDIVSISSGLSHTVGLKSDGTVVADGNNDDGQCNISAWKDIIAISAGSNHTVGLKSDGTVVAVGANSDSQCSVSMWTDIVAIGAGFNYTVGLKSDGTVVVATSSDIVKRDFEAVTIKTKK